MARLLIALLLPLLVTGCAKRPLNIVFQGDVAASIHPDHSASRLARRTLPSGPQAGPAIAIVDVDGLLVNQNLAGMGSMGENPVALFREKLEAVAADPQVQALVLRINSPGGGATAADMMRQDLTRLRQSRDIPVVACLMDVGTGGAYYLATAADIIVAHPTSVVGGIGVILNVYNLEDTLGQFNVVPIPVKGGDKIDMATPLRAMDEDEHRILQDIADHLHKRFKDVLAEARPQLLVATEDLDGRVFTAPAALEKRLVDSIGYLDDALAAASHAANCPGGMRLVMYRRNNDRAYTPYAVTPNVPLQNSLLPFNIPGLDRSSLPTFLYLWQADPSYVTRRASP